MNGVLGDAPLNPELLYLFVLGPGYGECILIRVPPDQWIVIDSFEIGGQSAALDILDEDASVAVIALTHPHQDHCVGFVGLLDEYSPKKIGCVHPRREDFRPGLLQDPIEQLKECAKPAYRRVWDDWQSDPSLEWRTFRSEEITVSDATLQSLHPKKTFDESAWTSQHINDLSSPMRLRWHDLTLLLGADATQRSWPSIAQEFPDLKEHHAMKLPHHVSTRAIDPSFGDGDVDRLWIGTPYSRGHKLPPTTASGGLAAALQFVTKVHLTSLPFAHDCDHEHPPCQTTRKEIEQDSKPHRTGRPSSDPDTQAERMIVAAFDRTGQCVVLKHGPGSLEVSAP